MSKITWSSIIPLVGGFSLGAHEAIGHPAEQIISFPNAFGANDGEFMNYYERYGTPYIDADEFDGEFKKVNIAVSTPPCAGLSMLTSAAASEEKRGSNAEQNDWMFKSMDIAFNKIDTDVLLIENAPGLYTNYGCDCLNSMVRMAKNHGRSLTAVKTSSIYHGLPQNRNRTFVFMWKSDRAPFVNYYNRPHPTASEYLKEVNSSMNHYDFTFEFSELNQMLLDLTRKKLGENWRQILIENRWPSTLVYVVKNELYDELAAMTENEKVIAKIYRIKAKIASGGGVWDGTISPIGDRINALIGKNMYTLIHPDEDRTLNLRECLHLMGHPHDFDLTSPKMSRVITQNVPVPTARDWVSEAVKFVNGELEMSNGSFVKQNNIHQRVDFEEGI